jgi:hypothetical protein
MEGDGGEHGAECNEEPPITGEAECNDVEWEGGEGSENEAECNEESAIEQDAADEADDEQMCSSVTITINAPAPEDPPAKKKVRRFHHPGIQLI